MKARPHRLERLLDVPGHAKRIGFRELLDDEQEAAPVIDDGVSDEWLVTLDHRRHVSEQQLLVLRILDSHLGQVSRSADRRDVLDPKPLIGSVDEPSRSRRRCLDEGQRRHPQRVGGGLDDLA